MALNKITVGTSLKAKFKRKLNAFSDMCKGGSTLERLCIGYKQ